MLGELTATEARVVFVALLAAYEVGFLAGAGQTPGRDLLGIEVARAGTSGRPGPGRAAWRLLVVAVAAVPDLRVATLLAAALAAPALVRADRRAVHDLLGGTWVVRHEPDPGDPPPPDLGPLDELRRRRRLLGPTDG